MVIINMVVMLMFRVSASTVNKLALLTSTVIVNKNTAGIVSNVLYIV